MNSHSELIDAYEAGVALLHDAVAGMSWEELSYRSPPGKWSTHEIVCHIADFEIINAERVMRVIAEDRPPLFNAEPEPFATYLAYANRDFAQQLTLIAAIRRHIALILRGILPEHFERTGNHSTDGPLTVPQLVRRVTSHIPHHVSFICAKQESYRSRNS